MKMPRQGPCAALLAAAICVAAWPQSARAQGKLVQPAQEIAASGQAVQGMESFDTLMRGLMAKYGVPGGAIAVAKDERLVFARGYGWADAEAKAPARPDSLFRVASISKMVTGAAALKLAEEGRLDLNAPAFALLGLEAPAGAKMDERLGRITVRHLLHHRGGWDRSQVPDPVFQTNAAAAFLGVKRPANTSDLARWALTQPLQFDPGARYAYTNFGYALLAQVIEKASGQSYEKYVQERILQPAGAGCMRLGKTRLSERAEGEVRYYDQPDGNASFTVFDPEPGPLEPFPYRFLSLETASGSSGWLASPVDLARFMTAIDGRPGRADVLSPSTWKSMIARPPEEAGQASASYYAVGCMVRPTQGGFNIWHSGRMSGTLSLLVSAANGLTWAVVFNSASERPDELASELDAGCWKAARAVRAWPTHDLFGQFPSCPRAN
jgi:CubicO group peptidase (beta-lactamase class C family)